MSRPASNPVTDASSPAPVLRRVLRAIELGREQGFHFPGNFLAVSFDHVTAAKSMVSLKGEMAGPGKQADPASLGVLTDLAMAACARAALKRDTRLATVSMQLQLTGAPCLQRLEAESSFHGFVHSAAGQQAISRVMVRSGQHEICLGTATFMVLDLPPGVRIPVLRPIDLAFSDAAPAGAALLDPATDLRDDERAIYARARTVLENAAEESDFANAFWGFQARKNAGGASGTLKNGPHIANRVGHVQGGILLGFAQATASAALSEDWSMTGITAAFVSPGEGERLTARARIAHQGRTTAVVRVVIYGGGKRRVLETMTTHSLRAAGTGQATAA